jgi:hypothetical protein
MTFAAAFKAKFREIDQFACIVSSAGTQSRSFLNVPRYRPVFFCLHDSGQRDPDGFTKLAGRGDLERPRQMTGLNEPLDALDTYRPTARELAHT